SPRDCSPPCRRSSRPVRADSRRGNHRHLPHVAGSANGRPETLFNGAILRPRDSRGGAIHSNPRDQLPMPKLSFPVTKAGLVLPVWIGLDGATTSALVAAGKPVPPPVQGRGALDTGSNVTSVACWILQRLGVVPASTNVTHTAAGPLSVKLFDVSLGITD